MQKLEITKQIWKIYSLLRLDKSVKLTNIIFMKRNIFSYYNGAKKHLL